MPDLPYRPLALSAVGLAGGVVAETASSPVIAGGGMLVGLAAIVTALGTSFLPQLNLMVAQWRFKERLTEAEAEAARTKTELDEAKAEIARLSRLAAEIPAARERADSAHDAADEALRGLRALQASGLFSPDFGPEDVPPVPERAGKPTMLIVGRDDEVHAFARLMGGRGWDVTLSYRVADAKRRLATSRDLMILDLTAFPVSAGLNLIRMLRERFPDAKVLVVRGDEMDADDLIRLDALKPDKVIARPIHLDELAEYAAMAFPGVAGEAGGSP